MISKDKFLKTYNQHFPNKFIRWMFRYFSATTAEKDGWVSKHVFYWFVILFVLGLASTIVGLDRSVIIWLTLVYSISLVLLVSLIGSAIILNNHRIKLIRKELKVSKEEYNKLVTKYLK